MPKKNADKREKLLAAFGSHSPQLRDIQKAIGGITRRLKVQNPPSCPLVVTNQLTATGPAGESQKVDLGDPNAAVHSAMKNPLLAELCGFVTPWTVESSIPIYGDRDYVIQLDSSSLDYDNTRIDVQSATPTAFRRVRHTHPVSFADIGSSDTQNGLLACLNDKGGKARYRAACVNSEAGLVKQVIVQTSNSLAGPSGTDEDNFGKFDSPLDDRSPQILHNEQFGTPEPKDIRCRIFSTNRRSHGPGWPSVPVRRQTPFGNAVPLSGRFMDRLSA